VAGNKNKFKKHLISTGKSNDMPHSSTNS